MAASLAWVVYTYHADAWRLDLLLKSIRIFSEPSWETIVLIDADGSREDVKMAERLPSWVRVARVQPSRFRSEWPTSHTLRGRGKSEQGWMRAQWAPAFYDKYTNATFIAHLDADTVLQSFALPSIVFDDVGRPVLHGRQIDQVFRASSILLDLPAHTEFMDSFPFVVRRRDFIRFRHYVSSRFGPKGPVKDHDLAFDEAMAGVFRAVRGSLECARAQRFQPDRVPPDCSFCWQSAMGSFLFNNERLAYRWSVTQALSRQGAFFCPSLNAAAHIPFWAYPYRTPHRVNNTPIWLRANRLRYLRIARFLVKVGTCAAHRIAWPGVPPINACRRISLPSGVPDKQTIKDGTSVAPKWYGKFRAVPDELEHDYVSYFFFVASCHHTALSCGDNPAAPIERRRDAIRFRRSGGTIWDPEQLLHCSPQLYSDQMRVRRALRRLNISASVARAHLQVFDDAVKFAAY